MGQLATLKYVVMFSYVFRNTWNNLEYLVTWYADMWQVIYQTTTQHHIPEQLNLHYINHYLQVKFKVNLNLNFQF
jgi:hypothetical protein